MPRQQWFKRVSSTCVIYPYTYDRRDMSAALKVYLSGQPAGGRLTPMVEGGLPTSAQQDSIYL